MTTEAEIYQIFADRRKTLERFAFRFLGNPQDAEDCVTDALLCAIKGRHTFRSESGLFSWVTSILRNTAYSHFNQRRRDFTLDDPERPIYFPIPATQERVLIQDETSKRLHLAIKNLSPTQKNAVRLSLSGQNVPKQRTGAGTKHRNNRHRGVLSLRGLMAA